MSGRLSQFAVPLGVVGIVLLLVVPLPAAMLDFLIVTNIAMALVVLLTSMYVKRPLDFSVFPSMLLVLTLFRLGLNVASTRLVLRDGYAGEVIGAFGHFVVGGSLIIGLVIFLILVVIQFAVITNGAGRVAEVGARFTLDAMPGKQMAIDADLNAGLIDEDTARQRRADIAAEADFYGAMDGGSKFVKGDAIAGIIITIVNLLGGFAIGMLQMGMSPGESLERFSLLTIGDGLVTQIPALLMSVSTGLIVTRATASSDMGTAASEQLTQSRTALTIAGGTAIVLALVPGMPKLPFIAVGAVLLIVGQRIGVRDKAEKASKEVVPAADASAPAPDSPEALMEQMRVHALEIQLAPDLVDLVGSGTDQDLLARVRGLRRKIAMELGLVVPPVRTRDSVELPRSTYVVKIAGVEVGRGEAPSGRLLALGDHLEQIVGTPVHEPVFGLTGKWIPTEMRAQAELAGATVVDRVSVLVTHLGSIITSNASRLLTREDVRVLVEGVKQVNPAVVDELVPGMLSLGEVQRVLQGLLTERVSIRDLPRVFEGLTLRAKMSTDPEGLIEAARTALGPAVSAPYVHDGILRVITLEPVLEQQLLEARRPSEEGTQLVVDPDRVERLLTSLRDRVQDIEMGGREAIVVCAPGLRPALRRTVALALPTMPVLSYSEVTCAPVQVETVGVVTDASALAA
ncbi:flagellar biosynthesis protein FlhA [Demequina sp. TTPB684]|uniref:flagellar biosynthesis protein FlhA n=1 Tax=unclassified Demequina TaxID=2620311 RepID=UPI001CF4B6C3|nr:MULTISPECIES: flagellar biosynthesis protein FlhA [unclassified Demequina]MCB2412897.1 flagellar biosynthesis protein FlhA [Demequina sp. TTPB684]UPU87878.1 flagellar biosynthesis protein FlhA [Demequina sp. TMPB413]